MKKNIFYIPLFLFLFCTISFSQTNNSENEADGDLFPENRLALQFAVGSNFSVHSLDGLMFALKYNFTDKSAIRFGVEFVGSSNNEIQTTPYGTISSPNNSENISVNSSFLFNLKPETNFIIYYGMGPLFSFAHTLEGIYHITNSWSAGLQFNIGAEWFAYKNLSFFAEYLAFGTYGKTRKYEIECFGGHCGNVEINTNDFVFNGKTARLGLSVNF